VDEVMTTEVYSVSEDTPLDEVVARRIKRVPVVRGKQVVGIVTLVNLLGALMNAAKPYPSTSIDDANIRTQLLSHLDQQNWPPVATIRVAVTNGIVTLSGVITDERERRALTRSSFLRRL
jgi:predicted transcriptional regulator